ncbi:MAG: translation elongation factor Ts [Pseudomonadota bacterium]|nr:translation elongation factor Ts [Pseudomonadota bacterium]
MAEITASLVKDLRQKTGAGMMDCKKALTEVGGDIEEAVDWLRKQGLAAAAKKAGRVAAEGLVAVAVSGTKGAAIEVNAETDFVARNDDFQALAGNIADVALDVGGDVDAVNAAAYPDGGTVSTAITELVATIGENMGLRRTATIEVGAGIVASYIHGAINPGLGRIGVLVGLESGGDQGKLSELGHQLSMHIAAANPQCVAIENVDAAELDREREVLADQARDSGKPEEIVQKMVDGRLRKYYEETVLLEQVFVVDGETKIAKVLENAANDVGAPVAVTGFVRFALGEGIERKEEDFAAEVAATLAS